MRRALADVNPNTLVPAHREVPGVVKPAAVSPPSPHNPTACESIELKYRSQIVAAAAQGMELRRLQKVVGFQKLLIHSLNVGRAKKVPDTYMDTITPKKRRVQELDGEGDCSTTSTTTLFGTPGQAAAPGADRRAQPPSMPPPSSTHDSPFTTPTRLRRNNKRNTDTVDSRIDTQSGGAIGPDCVPEGRSAPVSPLPDISRNDPASGCGDEGEYSKYDQTKRSEDADRRIDSTELDRSRSVFQKYKPTPGWTGPIELSSVEDFHHTVVTSASHAMGSLLRKHPLRGNHRRPGIDELGNSPSGSDFSPGVRPSSSTSDFSSDINFTNGHRTFHEQKLNRWRVNYESDQHTALSSSGFIESSSVKLVSLRKQPRTLFHCDVIDQEHHTHHSTSGKAVPNGLDTTALLNILTAKMKIISPSCPGNNSSGT